MGGNAHMLSRMLADASNAEGTAALAKGLALLHAVVLDQGVRTVRDIAAENAIAYPTARRMIARLERDGYVLRVGRGRYAGGETLRRIGRHVEAHRILTVRLRPALAALARRLGTTAHLGVLERDMVTYLVKEAAGPAGAFTREGGQLEAYCSGIGKVLLAALPERALDAYFDGGPFVALTERTITDPATLRDELARVRSGGFALDNGEIADGLYCVAVPVLDGDGETVAAASVSFTSPPGEALGHVVSELRDAIGAITDTTPALKDHVDAD